MNIAAQIAKAGDTFGGTGALVSAQRFRNEEIIVEKMNSDEDFIVWIVPVRGMRVVVDGHHALAASLRLGEMPRIAVCVERCFADDEDEEEWLADQAARGGSDWHCPITGETMAI